MQKVDLTLWADNNSGPQLTLADGTPLDKTQLRLLERVARQTRPSAPDPRQLELLEPSQRITR